MAFFENLSRKVQDVAFAAAEKGKEVAAIASEKAQDAADTVKTNVAIAGEQRRDLDALDLAAREGDVHFAVEIVVRAQADLREVAAALVLAEPAVAAGDGEQVAHGDALEARGLLEAVADAALRARRDVEGGDVLAVPEDLTARRRDEAHDDLGERRFAAAVGPGKDDELAVGNGDADVLQNGLLTGLRRGDGVAYVLEL